MTKPSILLVPGSFALPEFYDPVMNVVAEKGYSIHGVHLPSVGRTTGPQEAHPSTMYDDAAAIAQEVTKLVDEGKDVVLIAHSYGGVPMSQSTKGLSKVERLAQGQSGGIIRLGYITALVPPVGKPAMSVLADVPKEAQINFMIDDKGWMSQDPLTSAPIVFSDISHEEGVAWMKRFPRHSAISFTGELTHAGYKDISVSYLLCEEDQCIPLKNQKEGIDLIESVSGKKVDVTHLKAGHVPPASAPQAMVDWMIDVAKKAEASGSL